MDEVVPGTKRKAMPVLVARQIGDHDPGRLVGSVPLSKLLRQQPYSGHDRGVTTHYGRRVGSARRAVRRRNRNRKDLRGIVQDCWLSVDKMASDVAE